MAFDPDVFLAEPSPPKAAGFDPDAFLAQEDPRIATAKDKIRAGGSGSLNLIPGAVGLGEAVLGMGTGLVTQVTGGLHALGKAGAALAQGKGLDTALAEGADVVQRHAGAAYQPKTSEGKAALDAAMYLPQKAAEGWGEIGGAVGGSFGNRELGETLGRVGMESLMTVAPAPKALKHARAKATAPTLTDVQATYGSERTPGQQKAAATIAPKIDAAIAAQKHGMAIDVPELDTSKRSKFFRSVATPRATQEAMIAQNLGKPEQAVRAQLGMEPDAPLTHESVAARRAELAGPKNQISEMTGFIDDGQTVAELRQLAPVRTVGMGKEHATALGEIENIIKDIEAGKGIVDGGSIVKSIEVLRQQSRDLLKGDDITKTSRDAADISRGAADALERLIERRLAKDNPDLLNQYRANRETMAQTYLLDEVLDSNAQTIDLPKLARLTAKDPVISGAFKDIGKAYAISPESFGNLPKETWDMVARKYSLPGVVGAGLGTMLMGPGVGTVLGIAGTPYVTSALRNKAARNLTNRALRGEYLKGLGRERMGYGAPEPVAPPLSLAPEGELLVPPSPSMPMPEGRGLLSLADETVAALRQPEMQGVDFPLEGRNVPLYQRGGVPEEPRLSGPAAAQGGMAYEPGLPEVPAGLSKVVEGMPELPPSDIPANPLYGFRELSEGRGAAQPLPTLPPLERGLLDFADEPSMTVQALRGVPEEKMNFPLRQEVMDDLAPVTDPLRQQLNDLYALRDRQSGFWKQQTQAQIDELEKYFRAGLRQVGIDTPVDAWGQAMYGSGQPTKLPIEKTFTLEALRGVK